MKSTAKKGRPQSHHRTSSGEIIQGLSRLADGRWKVSGANPTKFTEPLEHRAIARFHEIIAKQAGNPKVLVSMPDAADGEAAGKAILRASKSGNTFIARIPSTWKGCSPALWTPSCVCA